MIPENCLRWTNSNFEVVTVNNMREQGWSSLVFCGGDGNSMFFWLKREDKKLKGHEIRCEKPSSRQQKSSPYPSPWKLIWHWKVTTFNRKYIFKWRICHRHVSFRGGIRSSCYSFWRQGDWFIATQFRNGFPYLGKTPTWERVHIFFGHLWRGPVVVWI